MAHPETQRVPPPPTYYHKEFKKECFKNSICIMYSKSFKTIACISFWPSKYFMCDIPNFYILKINKYVILKPRLDI